jgi:hypothetical protein
MAVLPLVNLPAGAQIGKVRFWRKEESEMTTCRVLLSPGAKAGTHRDQASSARIRTANQHPQDYRRRQHGTRPGFWQPASVHGRPFGMPCSSRSVRSSMLSAISLMAMACRADWHARCSSMYRGNVCIGDGQSHHRMYSLAMIALLASAFGFRPAVRAQDVPTASGRQGAGPISRG